MGLEYAIFETGPGWMGVIGSTKGLRRIILPQRSAEEVARLLDNSLERATSSLYRFQDLARRLRAYFTGEKVIFADELDLSGVTPFQRRVWQKTRLIPYRETRSYSWVARQINQPRALRAAGQALARNPLPIIIPCHRVVASDGRLGGFSGGLEMKRYLLSLERKAVEYSYWN